MISPHTLARNGDTWAEGVQIDPPPKRLYVLLIRVLPILLLVIIAAGLLIPATRDTVLPLVHSDPLVREYRLVEMATFGCAAFAGLAGLVLTAKFSKSRTERVFFLLFSLGMVFIAGEEVAWGQWLFSYETPEWMNQINAQDEMTIHNLGPLQGRSEFFRVAFGVAGLVGLWPPLRRLQPVRMPLCLAPSLVAVCGLAAADLLGDTGLLGQAAEFHLSRLSEAVELVIAFVGLSYVLLHCRARRS